jgi:membrane protein
MGWMAESYRRFEHLCRRGIWQQAALADRTLRGRVYALLRVVSITYTGLFENHITTRAAALSYASLLGLGPLMALAMLVAGFMLNQRDPAAAVNALNRVIKFIAPQVAQYEHLDQRTARDASPGFEAAPEPRNPAAHSLPGPSPALVQLIDRFVRGSRSGTAGVVGALILILIVIQLFMSVENAFNAVWGVRRGRWWLLRIVFYWTIVTLGTVLFFASLTALSAAAFISVFFAKLSFGPELLAALRWMLPALSIVLLVVVLTLFYRYIPNTRVFWWAALVGAIIVTGLLYLNNYLAFLYFKRVVLQKSLYGSLGILPILIFGLYVFWFYVLIGGQISYALQNVGYRSGQAAWQSLSAGAREGLSLLTLLIICRRFKERRPACSVLQLAELTRVPTQIINECLNRLGDLGLVAALPPARGQTSLDHCYQPARPLDHVTLAQFKQAFESYGENVGGETLAAADPVLQLYHDRLARHLHDTFGRQTLDDLLEEFPTVPATPD